ncbi:transposase, partial [Micromonospora sp. NPDC005173]|uniref:transposase n=1 Tax=Micromonospora sp. NPDC005173 TaxID=3157165 RepID=UPI0033AD7F2E
IRDPDFAAKAARVLDLYARTHDGVPLGSDEYVISSDEKTSIQARRRCHPCLPPGTARSMRVNHEYERGGALAYLAAYDVHQARVFSHRSTKTGITPFMALVEQVMTQQPYASAKRVFWVVDNGSSHRGQAAIDRLTKRFPNAVMVHTPVHASWLNQIEIYFSIVQRKVLTPNDFTSLDQVEDRLTAFEQRYNATARPFRWKFTPADIEDLMARIERHKQKEQNLQQPAGCDHQPAAHALAA